MTVWGARRVELDDDLGLLHLGAELLDDAALDLVESRPATRTTPTTGTLIEPSSADALDAEIGALALDGREDVAAVAFEDAHLQRIAGRDGEALRRRQRAGRIYVGLVGGRRPGGRRRPSSA
jgi:hypothetical protein